MLIIAHRGASGVAPENTHIAFTRAWEMGADAVECDIHLTVDNQIVVMHDASTLRTTGVDLPIAESTWEDLNKLDAGRWFGSGFTGERIPLLQELLKSIPAGNRIVIEFKTDSKILGPLRKVLAEYLDTVEIVFISFRTETLAAARESFPEIPTMLLAHLKPDPATGELIGYREAIESAVINGFNAVGLHYLGLDAWVVEMARESGLQVFSWTVDDPATARRLQTLGVAGLTTNRPAEIRKALGI